MNNLPLFYHPTTILVLDDDQNMLDALSACIHTPNKLLTFSSTSKITDYLSDYQPFYAGKKFINSLTGDENYEDIHHSPSDFDITTLAEIHNSESRLAEISTLILDYEIPNTNGLNFSKDHLNFDCKKILLTGQNIESEVIEGFNTKLIDRYLQKGTANLADKLSSYNNELTESYFINITSPLRSYLDADKTLPAGDLVFIKSFKEFCGKNNIIEYYLIDKNGSYLCYDSNGSQKVFLVHTEASLNRWIELNQDRCSTILSSVRKREKIPFFGIDKEAWQVQENTWQQCLFTPEIVNGNEKYYISCISCLQG